MNRRRTATIATLGLLVASTSVFASLGAHYSGASRDRTEFRLYLHGGEYLGRKGSLQSVRIAVHRFRQGRMLVGSDDCVYQYDDADRRKDRIECAERARSPLNGSVYVRGTAQAGKNAEPIELMVCVRHCTRVPQRLRLEEADEDNH